MNGPQRWPCATLADVAKWGSGGTPKATEPTYYGGDIPWAIIGDLNDSIVTSCANSITASGLEASSAKIVPPGTILIAMYGSIGKLGIGGMDMATNQAIAFARPDEDIIVPRYLFWYLRFQRDALLRSGKGATQQNISQTILKAWPIPLAPLAEQRRIVEVIEEQFSRLDAAEASLTRVERQANTLAEVAYGAVRSPRWPSVKLSTIARTSSGGTPSRRKTENFGGIIPWVKSGELGDSHVRATAECISDRGLASSSAKLLKRGTLMMAMYGATVGKLGILDLDSAATNQAVCAIEPHDAELIPFLWLCLRAIRRDLIDSAKGGAQPNISQGMIRDLFIPMPPPDERARLIAEIARQVSACERVAAAALKGRLQIRHLQRAILERAFSGRLVSHYDGGGSVSSASVTLGADGATGARPKRNGAAPSRPKSEVGA
ncbi:MAG: restriction endonuclease subunit S [Candidatus Tyrphobacter sp.]